MKLKLKREEVKFLIKLLEGNYSMFLAFKTPKRIVNSVLKELKKGDEE